MNYIERVPDKLTLVLNYSKTKKLNAYDKIFNMNQVMYRFANCLNVPGKYNQVRIGQMINH